MIKTLADAGLTQQQINYWVKHGVAPGSTETKSGNAGGLFGLINFGGSTTKPIGYKNSGNNNSAKTLGKLPNVFTDGKNPWWKSKQK